MGPVSKELTGQGENDSARDVDRDGEVGPQLPCAPLCLESGSVTSSEYVVQYLLVRKRRMRFLS